MASPHPAFSSRSDCPIPYVPEIELDLIKDCIIPPVPDPFFEAQIFPPLIPPITIGCPKITIKTRNLIGRPSKIVPKTRTIATKVTRQDGRDDCFPHIKLDLTLPCVLAQNLDPEDADPTCPMEVVSRSVYQGMEVLDIRKPTADSIPASRIVFPIDVIYAAPKYQYGCVHEGMDLMLVSYEGADPVKDDVMGVVSGSCNMKKDNTGFVAVAVDTTNKKVWVRPQSGGGGGPVNIQLVQVTRLGPTGSVGTGSTAYVKPIQLLPDTSQVPNFEIVPDSTEFSIVYLMR